MNEMIGTIFGNFRLIDENFSNIEKAFRKQKKVNRKTAFSVVVVAGTLYFVAKRTGEEITSLRAKISQLECDIHMLKIKEGENKM